MRQEGLISDHHWSELLFIFARIGERQAMQAAWQDWREAYGDEFRGFMDQYLTGPMRSGVSDDVDSGTPEGTTGPHRTMTDPITRLNAALEGRYRIERELGGQPLAQGGFRIYSCGNMCSQVT